MKFSRRRIAILIISVLIVMYIPLFMAVLIMGKIDFVIVNIIGCESRQDRLLGEAHIKVVNNGSLPLLILGGSLSISINDNFFCSVKLGIINVGRHSHKKYIVPIDIVGPLDLHIQNNISIRIKGFVYMFLPIYLSIEKKKSIGKEEGLLEIVDVFGLPKKRFLISFSAATQIIIKNVYLNATLYIYGDDSPGMIVYLNDTWVSEETTTINATIYIPSNESLGALINNSWWMDKPPHTIGSIVFYRESWRIRIYLDLRVSTDLPLPSMSITDISIEISDPIYIDLEITIDNEYSLEAKISYLFANIYAGDSLIANGTAENQTILPKTSSIITLHIEAIKDYLDEIVASGEIIIIGQACLEIANTTYLIPVNARKAIV